MISDDNSDLSVFREVDVLVIGGGPAEIAKAFRAARDYIDAHPDQPPLITVRAGVVTTAR
jgi:hypothetical protein